MNRRTGALWARAAGTLALVVAADQATKALARGTVERGERDPVFPGVELVNVRNDGVAFGLFEGGGDVLTAITAVAIVLLLAFFALHARRTGLWLATGLLAGGALGNLIDRLREGAVTDFIDLPLWPAFNLADAAITIGVLALLWSLEGDSPRGAPD